MKKSTLGLLVVAFTLGVIAALTVPRINISGMLDAFSATVGNMWHLLLSVLSHPFILGSIGTLIVCWFVGVVTPFLVMMQALKDITWMGYFATVGIAAHIAVLGWLIAPKWLRNPAANVTAWSWTFAKSKFGTYSIIAAIVIGPMILGAIQRGTSLRELGSAALVVAVQCGVLWGIFKLCKMGSRIFGSRATA